MTRFRDTEHKHIQAMADNKTLQARLEELQYRLKLHESDQKTVSSIAAPKELLVPNVPLPELPGSAFPLSLLIV